LLGKSPSKCASTASRQSTTGLETWAWNGSVNRAG
jgi:hypothetical protein